ncbi:hypothetical protein RJT34_27082 [Clitoria ternatea]|uniref:Fe2OG dioxygenase domain-containing protein n=1 Tax=Clitoria ternatea TaxID=43366 RepID=A0AAN9IG52_CLITE
MVATSTDKLEAGTVSSYDRLSEVKAFDDSKAGVQGLVENGVTKVPLMFNGGHSNLSEGLTKESNSKFSIPLIDLTGIHDNPVLRGDVVGRVRYACANWGFFQVINHGIPTHVLDETIKGTCRFHQQDAKWSDYLIDDDITSLHYTAIFVKVNTVDLLLLDIVIEYSKKIMELGYALFELLSEALDLDHYHLKEMTCAERLLLLCHYYPPCPEPELTMGSSKHSDGNCMTILLQDQIGGLQVLHENQWIDVPPLHGSLVVNVGDLLQLMTNDRFVSVQHRVLAKHQGPRISVASFFRTDTSKVFGPIKELVSEDRPPLYREISLKDYMAHRYPSGIGTSALSHFRLHAILNSR